MLNNLPILLTPPAKAEGGLITVFYEEIVTLIAENTLQAGRFYVIVDFQTIYDRPDYTTEGSVKYGEIETITSPVYEPLVCFALTTNKLHSKVMSTLHPEDLLQYDVRYTSTEVNSSPAKGRITERIDDKNNRTDYDHRYIFFKRYEDGEGNFVSYKDTGLAFQLKPTFTEDSVNNFLGNYAYLFDGTEDYPFKLSNNVFAGLSQNNTIGTQSYNNHFQGDFSQNTIGTELSNNVSYGGFISNKIETGCHNNTFTGFVYGNKISSGFASNEIQGIFSRNTTNKSFTNCLTLNGFKNNIIDCELNEIDFTFADYVYREMNCQIVLTDDNETKKLIFYFSEALLSVVNITD